MHDLDEPIGSQATTPLVGRPRGAAWRALQADGVVWEGQVFLVGGEVDLAARMIVTHRRLAFARGGEVVLDIGRPWLRPAPYLRRDGSVLVSIVPPGARYGEPPETVALRMREGQPAAGHLVAMLAGSGARRVPADLDALEAIIRPALPALPAHAGADLAFGAARWPDAPLASPGTPLVQRAETLTAESRSSELAVVEMPELVWANPDPDPDRDREPVVRQSAAPVASGRDRDWNLPMREHLVPRGQRRSRWGWALRLTGLVALLSVAAAFGAGRIPSPLDSFGAIGQRPTANLPLRSTAPTGPALVAQSPAEQTALAIGVGGPDGGIAPTGAETAEAGGATRTGAQTATETPEPAPTQPATKPTPAPEPTSAPAPAAAPEPTNTTVPTTASEPTATATATATAEPQPTAPVAPAAALVEPSVPTAIPAPTAAATAAPVVIAATSTVIPATVIPATTAPEAGLAFAPRLAVGGRTLPAFGLPPSNDGNWLVVIVDAANAGTEPAAVELGGFRLRAADGAEFALDPAADLVASIVGLEEAGGVGSTITLEPGEARRLVLLFQVDPAASGLELLAGETEIDLTETLAAGGDVADLPEPATAP